MSAAKSAIFSGRASWLLLPLPYGVGLGGLVTIAYLWATVHVDARATASGAFTCVLTAALMLMIWALLAQSRVRTVRQLATGRLAPTEANLLAAIKEVRSLPDWLRRATWLTWGFGAAFASGALRTVGELSSSGQLRIVVIGVTAGPITSVLVYLLALGRSRAMIETIGAQVPTKSVLQVLKSETPYRLRTRLAVFVGIFVVFPTVLLADATRVSTQNVLQSVAQVRRTDRPAIARDETRVAASRVVLLAALLVALALGGAAMAGRNISDPMRHIADEADRIARGDLREIHIVAAEGEIGVVTSNFTQMQALLQEIVGQLQKAGISIGTTTEQLMATSSKYETGAADQASSLNETSATTEELAQSARQISHNAGSVSELAQKTFEAARAGQESAKAFVSAVERMKHDNNSIAEAVTRLEKRVQQIGRIVEFITTVADRSDLLALSAELEGTKAGDVGRGFTLVAAEMRRLAENVIESTNEIEELIAEIREATQQTVGATARGMEHTESGTELASAVSHSLESVVTLAQNTSDSVRAISLATQQQQTSTDQLAEAMADILGITQQSLAATKQVTSANHELISLSGDLKGLVDQFQVKQ